MRKKDVYTDRRMEEVGLSGTCKHIFDLDTDTMALGEILRFRIRTRRTGSSTTRIDI